MSDLRKTHRGRTIDIDLIRMKQQLELKEINKVNIKREKDVDTKRRRGGNQDNKISEMLANQELVRQKIREQKLRKELEEGNEAESGTQEMQALKAPKAADVQQKEEKKDKPEVTGRRIIKRG
jgi:hypothetical protein